MNIDKVQEYAKEVGFAQVAMIPTSVLVFVPSFRKYCEDNDCGNFGQNYGCPPNCGTPEEMEKKALSYTHALVFKSENSLADAFDAEATKALKADHTYMTMRVMSKLRDEGITGEAIMAGPCNFCETCKIKTGEPCDFPDMRFSCLSAYCIDAMKLAKACEMEMSWAADQVTLLSLFLYNE